MSYMLRDALAEKFIRWEAYKLATWHAAKLTRWQKDQMTRCKDYIITRWQEEKISPKNVKNCKVSNVGKRQQLLQGRDHDRDRDHDHDHDPKKMLYLEAYPKSSHSGRNPLHSTSCS